MIIIFRLGDDYDHGVDDDYDYSDDDDDDDDDDDLNDRRGWW